jgi:hypothetical protein
MKGEEITALIDRDIYENAFERQNTEHIRFRGEKRAEGIERGFFLCPKCGRLGGVHGDGNYVNCNCGLRLYYTEEGFFDPPEPVATLAEWERVQQEALGKICAEAGGTRFADDGLTLYEIGSGHRETKLGSGVLILHPDALELPDDASHFPISTAWPWSNPISFCSPSGTATTKSGRHIPAACENI